MSSKPGRNEVERFRDLGELVDHEIERLRHPSNLAAGFDLDLAGVHDDFTRQVPARHDLGLFGKLFHVVARDLLGGLGEIENRGRDLTADDDGNCETEAADREAEQKRREPARAILGVDAFGRQSKLDRSDDVLAAPNRAYDLERVLRLRRLEISRNPGIFERVLTVGGIARKRLPSVSRTTM